MIIFDNEIELRKFKSFKEAVKAMISEEWFAGQLYLFYTSGLKSENIDSETYNLMKELFLDELDDHYINLCKFAKMYEFKIPKNEEEFREYSSKVFTDAYDKTVLQNKDVKFYLEKSIEAEYEAIISYLSVLTQFESELNEMMDFKQIILNNYYEEIEHYDRLKTILDQITCFENIGLM